MPCINKLYLCMIVFVDKWEWAIFLSLDLSCKAWGLGQYKCGANHCQLDTSSNSLFRLTTKKTPMLCFFYPLWGEPQGSNVEAFSCDDVLMRGIVACLLPGLWWQGVASQSAAYCYSSAHGGPGITDNWSHYFWWTTGWISLTLIE